MGQISEVSQMSQMSKTIQLSQKAKLPNSLISQLVKKPNSQKQSSIIAK
jgi:hypothetical protein